MKRLLITIFILLALTSFGYADQVCYVDEPCPLETIAYNTSENFYNGTVTTTLIKDSDILLSNQIMNREENIVNGTVYIYYSYNYTFNESGSYLRFSVAESKLGDENIIVEDLSNISLAGLIMSNWTWIVIVSFILVAGLLAIMLNNKSK